MAKQTFTARLGKTTYTLAEQPNGIIHLHRSNASTRETADFYVPATLLADFFGAKAGPALGRWLLKGGAR